MSRWLPVPYPGFTTGSVTTQTSVSLGSGAMTKPNSRHIASMVLFSRRHLALDRLEPSQRVLNDDLRQSPSEPEVPEVEAHQDGVFDSVVDGVRTQLHDDTEYFTADGSIATSGIAHV